MTDTIVLVENITDVNDFLKSIAKLVNPKIFSLNYLTHKKLEENNIPHNIGEDYLSTIDLTRIDDTVVNMIINWIDNDVTKKILQFNDIQFSSLIEQELLSYFMPINISAATILKIIEIEKPRIVLSATFLNDYTLQICKNKNISCIFFDKVEKPSLYYDKIQLGFKIGSLPLFLTLSRSQFDAFKKIFGFFTNHIFRLYATLDDRHKKTIILHNFDPLQYNVLINELSALDANVLLLNTRKPAVYNWETFKILINSKCRLLDLNVFKKKNSSKIEQEKTELENKMKNLWSNDQLFEKLFTYDNYTLWHSIKSTFTTICNTRFLESLERILLVFELYKTFKISSILEWAETGQEEKESILLAKKKGIKIIMLQHGKYPTSKKWDKFARFLGHFPHPLISDMQVVWGNFTKEYAISYGHHKENLFVLGSPRHDIFFNNIKNMKNKGIVVLAPTGPFYSADSNVTTSQLHYDNFIKKVCSVMKNFPDKKLVIKPHPNPKLTVDTITLVNEIDKTIPILINTDLHSLINQCELLITLNNSTIALDSIILGIPTISLQTAEWALEDEIAISEAILSITNLEDIELGIKKILYDKKFREKLKHNAKKFLEHYMANQGNASKKLAEFLIHI